MTTIILEVPHQTPATAWIAETESDIINIADVSHNMVYIKWNEESVTDCYGDDLPDDLKEILDRDGVAVEFGDHNGSEFESVDVAPSEIEYAKELIAHDLHTCRFLSLDEAVNFEYNGHQDVKAVSAVKKALARV